MAKSWKRRLLGSRESTATVSSLFRVRPAARQRQGAAQLDGMLGDSAAAEHGPDRPLLRIGKAVRHLGIEALEVMIEECLVRWAPAPVGARGLTTVGGQRSLRQGDTHRFVFFASVPRG